MVNGNELFLPSSETLPKIPARTVAMGTDRARGYMVHLLKNEKVNGSKKAFGPGMLTELHKRLLFYYPAWAGQLRSDDETKVGMKQVVKAEELTDTTYAFERWLETEIDNLRQNPEDINGALRVAAAAHYGVVELHPFNDGNGRLARVLMNGILMLNARERVFYNFYILPVPLLREAINEDEVRKIIEQGKEPKVSPYLQALREVDKSWKMNPLEIYIAFKWAESLEGFLNNLKGQFVKHAHSNWKGHLSETDRKLVEKLEERRRRLDQFIEDNIQGRYQADMVPNYFTLKATSK